MTDTVKWPLGYALLPPLAVRGIPWPLMHPATLQWHSDDPWIVHLDCHHPSHRSAHWDLSWELLADSLERAAGIGDVRITPVGYMPGGERHQIEFQTPSDHAAIQVRSASLRSFVRTVQDQWAEWPVTDSQIEQWLTEAQP